MGGYAPVCPFCQKYLPGGGVKDHIKAKHSNYFELWVRADFPQHWETEKINRILVAAELGEIT